AFNSVVDELASTLASLAPRSQAAMKKFIAHAHDGGAEQARALVRSCFDSADFAEGMAAQREGRAPRFSGV
ncbi:MAG: enoyl-CoA hydratase/isomerase family protein, partial [Pseudomonadales bacterium]